MPLTSLTRRTIRSRRICSASRTVICRAIRRWLSSDGQRSGFLAFNGTNQFVILDRSLSDLTEITVTAWVKWSGGASNQPVWYFGTASTNCMFLTPDDGAGHVRFSITKGGTTQTLAWTNPLPVGVWTHVAVSLSNSVTGRLYVNGTNVATGTHHDHAGPTQCAEREHRSRSKIIWRAAREIRCRFSGARSMASGFTPAR